MRSKSEHILLAANVNPRTGLATDYLNLFNEAIMLFELALDMPDMAEDLADWKTRGYVEHFEQSGFELKDVVIAAYHQASAEVREDFDAAVHEALTAFDSSIHILLSSNIAEARPDLEARLATMKGLVAELDAHIHGRAQAMAVDRQDEVDALF